jgi:putative ABC transport system permease protein
MTIAGVVGDVRHTSLTAPIVAEIYTPIGKQTILAMMLAIRADGDPLALAPLVRDAIWSTDRDAPLSNMQTMNSKIGESLGRPRLLLTLLGAFAALGVVLALVGVYGVVAYSAAQRRRELGIMVALGRSARASCRRSCGRGSGAPSPGSRREYRPRSRQAVSCERSCTE